MQLQPQYLALALLPILTLANAQFITSTTSAASCTPTTLTTSTATIVGFSKPTHAPGGVAGVGRIFPKEDFINNNVLTITSDESFWNKWLLPEQSAQKFTILENCARDCASAPLCASVFIYLDTRNQATSYWTCMTFASAMDTADLEEAPTEAYKFGIVLNRQCFVQPPDVVVPTLPPSSSPEPTPTPSSPPASEPSSEPEPSSTTTSMSATGPTPTPSCFTRFVPPASLTNFWPSDDFFIRAYRIENAESRFFPESDFRSPSASEMADICASDCANLPLTGRDENALPPCKFALAFSENYGGVPDENGAGGDYYRRCAFFTENITGGDLVDAEALFGFGRVKDQIGVNSLCDALPPTSSY